MDTINAEVNTPRNSRSYKAKGFVELLINYSEWFHSYLNIYYHYFEQFYLELKL